MVGSVRPLILGVAGFLIALVGSGLTAVADPPPQPEAEKAPAEKPGDPALFAVPGEDPPALFVPKHPRSVEERRQIEAARDFSAARALEDLKDWPAAIALLEEALKLEPDSVAILKRLVRLDFMHDDKRDQALQYSRRVLAADPGDTDTISRLVNHYNRNGDTSDTEAILKSVLSNPKLDEHAPGRLLAEFELGKLYSKLQRPEQAADAFAKVVAGLDLKHANRLSPLDQARILGEEPAEAYLDFGNVFLEAKRYDLAINAFERGLVYDEEHPMLPLRLAEALMKTGKGAEALRLVEHFLKRQPQGSEGYELLEKILIVLNREAEITPRLEEAAKIDSKNLPLQYALADRYYKIGQVDRAEERYRALLAAQPTPEGYRALAASLLKRKKADELLRVFAEAVSKPGGLDAIKPQLEAVIKDSSFADEMLEAGRKAFATNPPRLELRSVNLLAVIATGTKKLEKLVPILRLILQRNPSPQLYREIAHALETQRQFTEAAATFEEMFTKFPDERSPTNLKILGEYRRQAGKYDEAAEALREALKLEPNDSEAQLILSLALSSGGKGDEAAELLRGMLKNDPGNADINRFLGMVLMQAGKNNEAIAHYKALLERYPNNEQIVEAAHNGLSVAYVNLGDYAKGEAELEILYKRNPEQAGVNNDLGYLYADQGKNLEQAEAMIRKAVKEKPEEAAYLDSLGWVLFKRGKVKEAAVELEKAVKELNPNGNSGDATIYEHLGDVYFRLQEQAKARSAWEQAEKAASKAVPPDKRLPEIRKKLESLLQLEPAPKPASDDAP